MDNELILWQMRKIGYDTDRKAGIAHADIHFQLLQWLQDAYDHGGLSGNFHSDNIIREVWNKFSRTDNPLTEMDNYSFVYDTFNMIFSGDYLVTEASSNGC